MVKLFILAFLISSIYFGGINAHAQAGGGKSRRAPVTSKTAPDRLATTKTDTGTNTPLWQQNIVVNLQTGQRTTVEKVMESTTAATTSAMNGTSAPGGGYYYTPGPANRPSVASSSGITSSAAGTNAAGMGFINSDLLGGGMMLLQGAGLFQGFSKVGDPPSSDVCLECAEVGTNTAPSTDPGVTNTHAMPPGIPSASSLLMQVFADINAYPFQRENGTYDAYKTNILSDALTRQPLDELMELAKDEMTGLCPNYPNLNHIQKTAMVMMMFSHMMSGPNNSFNDRRVVNYTPVGGSAQQTGHGMCGIRHEFVRNTLATDYSRLMSSGGGLFDVSYNSVEDLYQPVNNIRLCVMEMHYTASIQAQDRSATSVNPFTHKLSNLSSNVRDKFKNYSICQTPGAAPETSGGVASGDATP